MTTYKLCSWATCIKPRRRRSKYCKECAKIAKVIATVPQSKDESIRAHWNRVLSSQGLSMARLKSRPGQKAG